MAGLTIGQVARRVCDAYACEAPVWIAELEAGALLGAQREDGRATVPSAFPPVKRDVSFLVDRQVAYAEVEALITVPLENVLHGLPRLTTLRSKSVLGLSSVVMIFEDGTNRLQLFRPLGERFFSPPFNLGLP